MNPSRTFTPRVSKYSLRYIAIYHLHEIVPGCNRHSWTRRCYIPNRIAWRLSAIRSYITVMANMGERERLQSRQALASTVIRSSQFSVRFHTHVPMTFRRSTLRS